jgi:hypothetical protein
MISLASRPSVCRLTRRASSRDPATPSTHPSTRYVTRFGSAAASRSPMVGYRRPAATMPTAAPLASSTGTCATSCPSTSPTQARPSVTILAPMSMWRLTSDPVRRTPDSSVMSTVDASDTPRALSAMPGNDASAAGSTRPRRTASLAATVSATDSSRRPSVSRNDAVAWATDTPATATTTSRTMQTYSTRNWLASGSLLRIGTTSNTPLPPPGAVAGKSYQATSPLRIGRHCDHYVHNDPREQTRRRWTRRLTRDTDHAQLCETCRSAGAAKRQLSQS